MVVNKQEFIEATGQAEGTHFFEFTVFDGILGLGFRENSVRDSDPVWYNIVAQRLVQNQVFSIWLKYYNEQDQEGGAIVFGGFDEAHFRGEHAYTRITETYYWQFEMKEILIGGRGTNHCKNGCQAMVDSGHSVIKGPSNMIDTIYRAIGADEIASVDCKKVPSMPTISFTIAGRVFSISPRDYINKRGVDEYEECSALFLVNRHDDDDDYHDDKLWILGEVFMRPYHTVFDYGNLKIGFAEAVQENQE